MSNYIQEFFNAVILVRARTQRNTHIPLCRTISKNSSMQWKLDTYSDCLVPYMMFDANSGIHVQAGSQSYASHCVSVRLSPTCIRQCKRLPIFFYLLNIKHFTSDSTSPNTNPKTLTTINVTINIRKDAIIISHSRFLPKVVGCLGMWQTTVSLGPRMHILAQTVVFHCNGSWKYIVISRVESSRI